MVVVGVAVLSACSGGGAEPSSAATPTTTTTTSAGPATTSAPAPSTIAKPAVSNNGGQQRQPFVADTNPDVSSTIEGFPVLVSVAQGEHEGYRRYVFTFDTTE